MRPILISIPPETSGLHERRAWTFALRLMDAGPVRLTHDTTWQVPLGGLAGAVVVNSEGDAETLRRLRRLNVPALYYPSLGPVVDGFFGDDTLFEYSHLLRTKIKLHAAHAVLADSWTQARAAQAHYDSPCPWMVLPGGAAGVTRRPGASASWRDADGAMLWTVEPMELWAKAAYDWTRANPRYRAARCTWEQAAGLARPGDLIFLPYAPYHPDILWAMLESGAALLTPDAGLLDTAPATLYALQADGLSGACTQDAAALAKAFDAAAGGQARGIPTAPDWSEWARLVRGALTGLANAGEEG